MKKVYFFTLILACSNLVYTQNSTIPNSIFHLWDHTPGKTVGSQVYPPYDEPNPDHFWTTSNPSTHTLVYDPTVMKTTDAYEGEYACLMRSTTFPFGIAAGSLISGEYRGGLDAKKAVFLGRPWTGRPDRFVGYYKYIPVDNDLCKSYVMLFKSIGGNRDTIGLATFTPAMEKNTVTSYTKFDIPITYYNSNDPDSIVIIFTASADGENFNGGDGSELYIDKIMLLYPGETAVNYTDKESAHFWVYPNPTIDYINFTIDPSYKSNSILTIYNNQGKVVKVAQIENEFNQFDIQDFNDGFYTYQIIHEGDIITEGKFLKH